MHQIAHHMPPNDSLLLPLSVTVFWCRFQPVRDQALTLLEQIYAQMNDYTEGVWNFRPMYPPCKWVRELEGDERDSISRLIPRQKRVTFTSADVNMAKRRITWRMWKNVDNDRKMLLHDHTWYICVLICTSRMRVGNISLPCVLLF